MNHDQGISIPQGPITRTRAKKLQQTLYTYIQALVGSSKKILKDVGDLHYMLGKVKLEERDEFMELVQVQQISTFHLLHYFIII